MYDPPKLLLTPRRFFRRRSHRTFRSSIRGATHEFCNNRDGDGVKVLGSFFFLLRKDMKLVINLKVEGELEKGRTMPFMIKKTKLYDVIDH